MTIKDTYRLQRMDRFIDTLGDAKYFTTSNAYSGYWNMKLRKKDKQKTAFVFHAGTFQCFRMPFGLTDIAVCFQRSVDLIMTIYK